MKALNSIVAAATNKDFTVYVTQTQPTLQSNTNTQILSVLGAQSGKILILEWLLLGIQKVSSAYQKCVTTYMEGYLTWDRERDQEVQPASQACKTVNQPSD